MGTWALCHSPISHYKTTPTQGCNLTTTYLAKAYMIGRSGFMTKETLILAIKKFSNFLKEKHSLYNAKYLRLRFFIYLLKKTHKHQCSNHQFMDPTFWEFMSWLSMLLFIALSSRKFYSVTRSKLGCYWGTWCTQINGPDPDPDLDLNTKIRIGFEY